MRLLPTRARLAGAGLGIAAVTIIALAVAILVELEREVDLHRAVIAAQQVKDSLDKLRTHLTELRAAARLSALTGDADAYHEIERRAVEVESELGYLAQRASADAPLPTFEALAPAARMLVMHARSISTSRGARGTLSSAALAREAERVESEAIRALERSDAAVTERINRRTEAQIQLGERLRKYVSWLLIGSIAVLAALFAGYRRLQARDRETQRRIEHLAHFDMVTGLPNRALLSDRLAQETARARRGSSHFALLMFDLDGFKKVNDTWGHAAGDRVLTLVGERVRKCVRASDTVGRLGGDEFLAILPETTLTGALGVADKLRESLREPYPLDKAVARLSTSVGVSLFPDHGTDPEALLRAADAALYRAKRAGKDRTEVATEAPRPPQATESTRDAA
jgi:diguanylate cyclase (GGDEF)-like protein